MIYFHQKMNSMQLLRGWIRMKMLCGPLKQENHR